MTRRVARAAFALWLGLAATAAQAADTTPCLMPGEAAGLALVLAPEAIKAVGITCANTLPPTALVRQTSGPFLAKYQAAADTAWNGAKAAIAKIAGDQVVSLLDSDLARPMVGTLIAPMVVKNIKSKDCGAIDHILTLLAPLPPRNAAELVVTIVQLSNADKPNRKPDLPICPMGTQ